MLIVEDEVILAMDTKALLEEFGCDIIATAPSVGRAPEALNRFKPDAVVLDLNLNGTSSVPAAIELQSRHVPFVVTSGYGSWLTDDDVFHEGTNDLLLQFDRTLRSVPDFLEPRAQVEEFRSLLLGQHRFSSLLDLGQAGPESLSLSKLRLPPPLQLLSHQSVTWIDGIVLLARP